MGCLVPTLKEHSECDGQVLDCVTPGNVITVLVYRAPAVKRRISSSTTAWSIPPCERLLAVDDIRHQHKLS